MRLYFAFLAVLFIVGAIWLLVRRSSVAARGFSTSGKVVAFESRPDEDSMTYLPVVDFTDRQGISHRFTSVAGSTEQRPAIGSTVPVRYLPQHPEQAYIASFLHMWAAPLGLFALGAGCMVAYFER